MCCNLHSKYSEGVTRWNLCLCSCAAQLEFQVVGAGGKDTFVAVDDIFISSHPCPDRGGRRSPASVRKHCSLESFMAALI